MTPREANAATAARSCGNWRTTSNRPVDLFSTSGRKDGVPGPTPRWMHLPSKGGGLDTWVPSAGAKRGRTRLPSVEHIRPDVGVQQNSNSPDKATPPATPGSAATATATYTSKGSSPPRPPNASGLAARKPISPQPYQPLTTRTGGNDDGGCFAHFRNF